MASPAPPARRYRLERGTSDDLDEVMAVMEAAFGDRFGEAWTRSQCAGILPMAGVSLIARPRRRRRRLRRLQPGPDGRRTRPSCC